MPPISRPQIRAWHEIDSLSNKKLIGRTCIYTACERYHFINFVPGTRKPPLVFSRAWHKVDKQTASPDAARTRRAWSEGRERERTPQRPGGEAVPPKFRVGAGSSGFAFQGGSFRNRNHKIHNGVQCPQEIGVGQKKPPDFSDGLYSRDRTRTCDLRVMSPTSCQLLYPALTEPHYTEVKDLSQPVPA